MLKHIDPLLGPDLLCYLRSMGHGDEIAIVDANFPAQSTAKRLVRLDGISAPRALQAVLSVMPLDAYAPHSVLTMRVVNDAESIPDIVEEFQAIVTAADRSAVCCALERFDFYERVKQAFAVVATGERRLYGNILLKKGVIDPDDRAPVAVQATTWVTPLRTRSGS